jgi:GWxTD domain-containing protein
VRLRQWSLFLVLLLCVVLVPGIAAGTWALPDSDRQIEGTQLSPDQLFARIDSLEAFVDQRVGRDRALIQWRLAQLYISTGLAKHRRHALDLLEEASELDPENPEPDWLWAELASSMEYHSAVRDRLEQTVERHPGQVESLIVLGRSEFRLGVRRLDESRLRRAREVFRDAVDADSTRAEVWHGLAVCAIALEEYGVARRCARSLSRSMPSAGLFIEAAAALRLGDEELAWSRYSEALELVSEAERSAFLLGQGFFNGDDLAAIAEVAIPRQQAFEVLREFGEDPQPGDKIDWDRVLEHPSIRKHVLAEWWTQLDRRPAQAWSTAELEYWTRLVEADVLFGQPGKSRRGWHTPPGEVWVRWGRPTSVFYDPGSSGATSRVDALHAAGVRFPPEHFLPLGSPPIWVWTYRSPGTWISFLFTDNSRTSAWSPSESSMRDLVNLRALTPILLPAMVARPFDVAVSAVVFPRPGADAVVETYIALEPTELLSQLATPREQELLWYTDRDTMAIVDWSITDATGERIDHVRRIVGPSARRSVVLRGLDRSLRVGPEDPFILAIGVRLPAGRYRIGVEVLDPVTGARSTRSFALLVPEPEPGGLLEMSGLELASAFTRWTPGVTIPPEFVKYAMAIVPTPAHRVPAGSDALGVYFELRNLAVDANRISSFDVRYAIYRSSREIRDLVFQDRLDTDGLDLIAPASLSFLEETSGLSPEGLVVKGIELDVGELQPGDYVLVVSIHDRIAEYSSSQAAAFRISSH